MEKKRWVLILMTLCLALAFSVSPAEAQKDCDFDTDGFIKDTNKCHKQQPLADIDCDDDDINVGGPPPCDSPPPPSAVFPRIGAVANQFESTPAAGFIADALGGSYTKLQIKTFNNMNSVAEAAVLRAKYDVLLFNYQGPNSIRASMDRLLFFMNATDDDGIGGGIIFEDPSNVADMEPEVVTTEHTGSGIGASPAIVDFSGPSELSAFNEDGISGNPLDSFGNGTVNNCADNPPDTGTTRGLGFGCLANVHITFDEDPGVPQLAPFLHLASDSTVAVGLYGEFGPGRMLITGPDHEFHASRDVEFQANHFFLLTNEIIWVSQWVAQAEETDTSAMDAVDDCVDNAATFLAERFLE